MAFNENTRVKIPAILHLCKLGYKYVSLKDTVIDPVTNIFTDIFEESIKRINKDSEDFDDSNIKGLLDSILLTLSNDDLGKAFYQLLLSSGSGKLIDFANFENNSFHVVTELTFKNGEDEFRPDITLLINGMPLAFIEVKKPNNKEGILAERDRINVRFKNSKFKKFINQLQILVFSNNMPYSSDDILPIQGAFYSTTSYISANFNYFREEEKFDLGKILKAEDEEVENFVLKDNNLSSIKYSPEFLENKNPESPTNKMLTSLFQRERLSFLLKYGIAYVQGENGVEKHIMRYPQFFATKAIETRLDEDKRKGIIWHTQGSGKTALSYYATNYLTDYFNKKGIVPKFYFIVDRLDLMNQADSEFTNRGLVVHTVDSKEQLQNDFKSNKTIHNKQGKKEITVVNIHKFKEETSVINKNDYDLSTQRVYFLDEAHRSYDPKGSFLANLISSDQNAIIIALTGTPLILGGVKSTQVFGDYIHKYYYNSSISDGYTLRLIREGIETKYKLQLAEVLREISVLKGDIEKRALYSHEKFVEPMLDYIVNDFENSRIRFGNKTIGAMVVCDSSDQAKKMFEIFNNKYTEGSGYDKPLKSALILHDVDDKQTRKDNIVAFKKHGTIDILFVFNMLLTGFDAPRLKKLYLGRVVKTHNLLQTLTRVNRPYKEFRYGFVVDFADISKEFDETNRAYMEELNQEYGEDEMESYSNLFMSKEEIESTINEIKDKLFSYDLLNAEKFSQQISEIDDRKVILEIKKSLDSIKNLYNIIRLYGHFELLEKIDFKKFNDLYKETVNRLELLNLKETINNQEDASNLLNVALENILFNFKKVSEEELVIAGELKEMLRKTREAMNCNIDKDDQAFISLYEELRRLFKQKNLDEVSQEEMRENIASLEQIYEKIKELNRKNELLREKYDYDPKYARIHKRVVENKVISNSETEVFNTLMEIKQNADKKIMFQKDILKNEGYFDSLMMNTVVTSFDNTPHKLDPNTARSINNYVVKEYISEYKGTQLW